MIGAGGFDGASVIRPLKNVLIGVLIFTPVALHKMGSGNEAAVALLAAIEAYSVGRFATA